VLFQRRSLYAKLLGLTGTPQDATLLESFALAHSDSFRPEAEGTMSGYLALGGQEALDRLVEQKVKPAGVVFAERYAALQAIRFCHEHAPDRIPAERLYRAMNSFLDDPELVDLAIIDLMRWNDWTAVDKLRELSASDVFDAKQRPLVIRAIIRYLYAATHDVPEVRTPPTPDQKTAAERLLDELRQREPDRYREALRFFIRPASAA
jgi:hypothetical protein